MIRNNRPVILFCLILLKVLFSFKEINAQSPQITSFTPDSGSVGTLVTITGTDLGNPIAFSIGGVSALVISNSGTTLIGMVMPGAGTGLVSVATAGGSVSSSKNFIVKATPFPGMQEGNKIVGTGNIGAAAQGFSVAVSADGNTAIVGGNNDNSNQGAVWIYTRSGGIWTQQGNKLVGSGNVGAAKQGVSVAISADGNTAIVGGNADNSSQGATWVWVRSGGVWTQQGSKLVGSGNVGVAQQGIAVSISADGNTALVGGNMDNTNQGAVWVWTRTGSNWSQQGNKLVGTGNIGAAQQGITVAISADGNTAIAGATADNGNQGAVWVYTRAGGIWTQQGNKLVGTGNVGAAQQGYSVALSANGNTAIIGGSLDNASLGATWVFIRSGNSWTQEGNKLVGTGFVATSRQGFSVSLSADGNTAIIGGPLDNAFKGATWVFTRTGGIWTQQGSKLLGTGAFSGSGAQQGRSVSLSADGSTALVGGSAESGSNGASWFFIPLSPPTITAITPASGSVGTLVTISGTNLINPSSLTIGGVPAIVISNTGTSIVAMAMPGTVTGLISIATIGGNATSTNAFTVTATPFPGSQQGSKLTGTGSLGNPNQGNSVSVSADGNTAIVGGPEDNGGQGAAWVYTRTGGIWTQQGNKLVGTGNVGAANQGYSVAISADGNTAVTGGYSDNNGQGAIWIWTRSGAIWSQQGSKLIGTGNFGVANQGYSVSIAADGNTVIAGGNSDNAGRGAAWVWVRTGSVWSQQGTKLVGSGTVGNPLQGSAVSLSADGNTAIVGGYFDDSETGAAWVFARAGSTWTQQGSKFVGTGSATPSQQGFSVSLSADGNTALVGAPYDNGAQGAAWVYTRSGSTWTQQGNKLVGTGNVGVAFQGYAVSLSADGDKAIVGGKDDNGSQGAAWVYSRSGGTWTQLGSKLVGTGNLAAAMGTSVSLSSDGSTAIVGGFNDNSGHGAAWVFIPTPPPLISSIAPTNGAVGTLVTITGNNLNNLSSFSIGSASAITISNNGTTLIGMVMPGAVTGPVSITTLTGTVNSNSNFTVTSTPYPGAQQGNKLVGTGNVSAASQGVSVAVSADGNTAIVGGYSDNGGIGAVWVYVRAGSTWTQQGNKLVGSGSVGASHQGISVAISADGNTAVVGGRYDNSFQGAAWIWTRTGTTWSQQGSKLVGTGNVGTAEQGWSVAISADGNTAIVGGKNDNSGQGAGWIFSRNSSSWAQQGSKLVGTGNTGAANHGISVAMSADGKTCIVGGFTDNSQLGAAWVYVRNGNTWIQQGSKLVGTGSIGVTNQGNSVSLSADGNTAMIGGRNDNGGVGAAWVFTRNLSTWTQQGNKLVGTGNVGASMQGVTLSLSADGNTAIVGGFEDNSLLGAAWVWTRSANTWSQQGTKLVGSGNTGGSNQGFAVSLSANGNTAFVGGYKDNNLQGASWVFIPALPPTITSFTPTSGSVGTLVTVTGTNLNNLSTFTIGGVSAITISNDGTTLVGMVMPGAVTGYVAVNTSGGVATSNNNFSVTPTPYPSLQQGNKLVGSGNIGAASHGASVAISADGNTAIVGGPDDNNGLGAAWIYIRTGQVWTQQGSKLAGTGNIGISKQGSSVAISADGNTAIVGGSIDNNDQGAAWIWVRSGSTWTQQGNKLVGSGNIGAAYQGSSVSLSADGNTAIVGGFVDNSGQGAAWVWVRFGGVWTQQGSKLVGTGSVGTPRQGHAVFISADGNTAILGGYSDNSNQGAIWVFTRSGGLWTQQSTKLVGTGGSSYAQQGISLALSADGNTLIAGGLEDNLSTGAAWVWTRTGNTWLQQGSKLVGTGSNGAGQQGSSVSLSADGNTVIIGGYLDNGGLGAFWVFTRSGGIWSQQGNKRVGLGYIMSQYGVYQGNSVALSADGKTSIIGGYGDNLFNGAAWIFVPCYSADQPVLSATSSTNCGTQNTTLSIASGSLNNSINWKWYSDSCGGNLVGTGTSIAVSPVVTTTYFARGEGGCAVSGICGSITITVNPIPAPVISGTSTFCPGNSATLDAGVFSSYNWSTGATTQTITASSAGTYSVTVTNAFGCTGTVSTTINACQITLNLKAYLQGFYIGGGFMQAVLDPLNYPSVCDSITVELHASTSPFQLLHSVSGTVNTSGMGNFVFPGSSIGNGYYIAIRHRNAIEIWSKFPILFNGTAVTYDFTIP